MYVGVLVYVVCCCMLVYVGVSWCSLVNVAVGLCMLYFGKCCMLFV